MKIFVKAFMVAAVATFSAHAFAAPQEAPPREPPYTDSNEFDSVLGEDPTATNAIPVSPAPTNSQPPAASQSTLDDWSAENPPVQQAAPKKQQPKKVATGYTSSATDEVDRTPQKGVKLIHHPDAKKGLIRIEQDGTYVYKIKTTPKNQTGIVRFGMMDPPKIVSADGYTDFKGMYGSSSIGTLMFDYEWQPFTGFGKLGVQTGFDFAMANGHGHFLKNGAQAQEKYTFVILPLNLGLIYRLEYFKRQWIAPYISGGGSYIAVAEMRDDDKNNFSGTPAAYGAGGLMFNLTAIDKSMAFNLDSEYGVGNLWIVAEYRYQKAFSEDLDFTGGIMSIGISADF
ncbi:MAG: hypothetical protein JSU04_06485 [Bdellovibrionales bacterium]|nr:hypothetical protein [Bdellovibrionales bacterium]